MLFTGKIAAILVLSASALAGPAAISAIPAEASVAASHAGAILCNGDVCIQNLDPGGNAVTIHAWANRTGFTGHFELYWCGPDNCNDQLNSPNQYWRAGGSGYDYKGVPGALVSACVDAWEGPLSSGWKQIGQECFYVAL
jgi:hypothetical protein